MKKVVILLLRVVGLGILVYGCFSAFTLTNDNLPRLMQLFIDPSLIGVVQVVMVICSVLVCVLLLGFAVHLENQEVIVNELRHLNAKVHLIEKMDEQESTEQV